MKQIVTSALLASARIGLGGCQGIEARLARERHLKSAVDLLIPLAHQSMHDSVVALQAAASAMGRSGALGYAALLLRERAGVQDNVMDTRADLERADELERMAHVRDGVATVDLVTIATP